MNNINNIRFGIKRTISRMNSLKSFKLKTLKYIVYDFYYYRSFTLNFLTDNNTIIITYDL